MTGTGQTDTTRVKKEARPWAGFFLGLVLGLALAVLLQQAGVWPADRLAVFGMTGLFSLLGILMSGAGRARVGPLASLLPLFLAVGLVAFGATGLADINESGNINGGCEAQARSSVDQTNVFDTNRREPFDIDPDGSLEWLSTSPSPIMDHYWAIFVEFAGFDIMIDDGTHPNQGGSVISGGTAEDLTGYINTVTNVSGQPLLGTFIVSGEISVDGTVVCDGFGFVRLTSDNPFESLLAKIAGIVAALALLALLLLAFNRYRDAEIAPEPGTGSVVAGGVGTTGPGGGGVETTATDERSPDVAGGGGGLEQDDDESPPGSGGDQLR